MKILWPLIRVGLWLVVASSSGCVVDRIMDTEDRRHYLDYRTEAERINMEREKSGLPPRPILSYEQWKKQ